MAPAPVLVLGRPPRPSTAPGSRLLRREIRLHGQHVRYLEAGAEHRGPVVVLLHGLASSSATWSAVLPLLGEHVHVLAPDLLGHGQSAKPASGDYSLGAYAAGLRDLLVALGDEQQATIVGHSFGGGVAMQFAYQFPELTGRLVLVSSGGLGPEVSLALRAATLPGTGAVLRALSAVTPAWLSRAVRAAARRLSALPGRLGVDLGELVTALDSFADPGARSAFVHTTRSVLSWSGQRLAGTERFSLLTDIPVLLVTGGADPVIPAAHTRSAHEHLPGSRLEVFDQAGHFPHAERPGRFARLLADFLATTDPAHADLESLRHQLRSEVHTPV